jgi:hypothetical protein
MKNATLHKIRIALGLFLAILACAACKVHAQQPGPQGIVEHAAQSIVGYSSNPFVGFGNYSVVLTDDPCQINDAPATAYLRAVVIQSGRDLPIEACYMPGYRSNRGLPAFAVLWHDPVDGTATSGIAEYRSITFTRVGRAFFRAVKVSIE